MRSIKFKDRSMNQKLFLTYVFLIIIPLILIGSISYTYSISFLEGRIVNSFRELNRQMRTSTDAFLKNMLRVSESPFYDQELLTILSKDYRTYEYPLYEKSSDFKYINDEFFRKIFLFNSDIDSLVIYADNNEVAYRKGYQVIYNYDYKPFDEPWFRQIEKKRGQPVVVGLHPEKQVSRNSSVMSVGQVIVDPATNQKLGTFIVNFRDAALRRLYQGLNPGPEAEQMIVDENNKILFSTDSSAIGLNLEDQVSQDDPEYYIVHNTSDISGWKFYSIIHKQAMFHEVNQIRNFIAVIVGITIVTAFCVALLVSRGITNPIKQLSRMMRRVEIGDFNVHIDMNRQDEIGRLGYAFNTMTKEIQQLIQRIKEEEHQKRSAELNALQAQINPHFLYNTLSVVRWMSQAQMADNITETLDSLIGLLTFSARNTKEFVTIEEEIAFIQNYISLLELRYYNTFEATYQVDDEVLRYQTLKFIVQPFVENAIFHGFADDKHTYRLNIDVRRHEQGVRFMITDNGIGMSQEQVKELMDTAKGQEGMNSIGVRNVSERIQLHFGSRYGVQIHTLPGEGTTIFIDIPVLMSTEEPSAKEDMRL
ncbi:sensor histidine kinase [Paenibacillus sp. sgz500958]|uniref:sensor histidine kinase n=1 Tax=Paenibacillus sp. sgz500958 TaxID=3242475 RepID=UPI0036D3352C